MLSRKKIYYHPHSSDFDAVESPGLVHAAASEGAGEALRRRSKTALPASGRVAALT
jgi:hypothetical protein